MESEDYREFRLGPLSVGFGNEWRESGGVQTWLLIGAGRSDSGVGIGITVAGLCLTLQVGGSA